jgi:hypothetical protein
MGERKHFRHYSLSTCPKKINYEYSIKVNESTQEVVVERLSNIRQTCDGIHFSELNTFVKTQKFKTITAPPKAAKRIQEMGYTQISGKQVVFCNRIDYLGNFLTQKEGTETNSYSNVFISISAESSHIKQFDFIFLNPLNAKRVQSPEHKGTNPKRTKLTDNPSSTCQDFFSIGLTINALLI